MRYCRILTSESPKKNYLLYIYIYLYIPIYTNIQSHLQGIILFQVAPSCLEVIQLSAARLIHHHIILSARWCRCPHSFVEQQVFLTAPAISLSNAFQRFLHQAG